MSFVVRQDDVRRQNQFGVLMALRRHGSLSRTELCAATGLSASTVTVITNSLMERGVLRAESLGEFSAQRRGRPQVQLSPDPAYATVGIVILALNRIHVAISDYAGHYIATSKIRIATRKLSADGLAEAIIVALRALLDAHGDQCGPLLRIALAAEGIVDADGTMLVSSPVIDVSDVALGAALSEAYGVPVDIANECNMIAEALHWKNPDRYGANFAAILLSLGVGMGLYLNGKLFSGIASSAVEFGHMRYIPDGALCRCGRRGCIEAYAGEHSIWRAATGADTSVMLQEDPPEDGLQMLAEKARQSDGPERQAFHEAGKAIGTGLSNLFTMFDPIPLVFTGPGVPVMDLMIDSIREALSTPCFGLPVAVSVVDQDEDNLSLIKSGSLMSALIFLDGTIPGVGEMPARAV